MGRAAVALRFALASGFWLVGAIVGRLGLYSALVPDVRDEGGFGVGLFALPVAVVLAVFGALVAKPARARVAWRWGLTAIAAIIALFALFIELAPNLRTNRGWLGGLILFAVAAVPGYFAWRLARLESDPEAFADVEA
jgi:hypothetical protein